MSKYSKRYEKISQKWLCGRQSEGNECMAGPDKKGRCHGGFECYPQRKGDRWFCTRPKKLGGTCDQGPLSDGNCCRPIGVCQPVLNLRYRRARTVQWVMFISILLLALVLAGKYILAFVNPGKISSAHAVVTECSACHGDVKHQNIVFNSSVNDDKCLSCHEIKDHPNNPHNLSLKELAFAKMDLLQREKPTEDVWSFLPMDIQQVPCATCHQEHKNDKQPLTAVPNKTCQACHSVRFKRFDKGHPEFFNYPSNEIANKIHFDHSKHMTQYFKDEQYTQYAPDDCQTCHTPDNNEQFMALTDFDSSCASCHQSQIMGYQRATDKGIAFITVFALDVESLKNAGVKIGSWPEYADAPLTPFLRYVLEHDSVTKAAFMELKDVDFDDLSELDEDQLAAIAIVIHSYKQLLFNLSHHGPDAIYKRLKTLPKLALNQLENIPEDTVRNAIAAWFPNLDTEIKMWQEESDPDTVLLSEDPIIVTERAERFSKSGEEWAHYGGWYWDGYSLYYRPRSHEDRFLYYWLNVSSEVSKQASDPDGQAIFRLLSAEDSPGNCMKCHAISEQNGQQKIHWQTMLSAQELNSFTKFSHQPHLSLMNDDCSQCHKLQTDETKKEQHDFAFIEKSQCVDCHVNKMAPSNCTQCHTYHFSKISNKSMTNHLDQVL